MNLRKFQHLLIKVGPKILFDQHDIILKTNLTLFLKTCIVIVTCNDGDNLIL